MPKYFLSEEDLLRAEGWPAKIKPPEVRALCREIRALRDGPTDANCDECLASETQLKNENATLWLEVRRLREANEALFVAVGDDGYAEDRSEFWAAVARCCALHIAHDIAEGTK